MQKDDRSSAAVAAAQSHMKSNARGQRKENDTTPFTIQEILAIIVSEASNSCFDGRSTYEYFEKHYPRRVSPTELKAIINALNFPGIRESSVTLYSMLTIQQ